MRFPLHITTDNIRHQFKHAWKGNRRYPFVLMLEPLYTCNLACMGCAIEREGDTVSVTGPEGGLRSRALCCEDFRIGDGNPEHSFVNLSMKVGRGRDLETRMQIGQLLFDILITHLQPIFDSRGLAVSFEMRELEEHVKFNRKNI